MGVMKSFWRGVSCCFCCLSCPSCFSFLISYFSSFTLLLTSHLYPTHYALDVTKLSTPFPIALRYLSSPPSSPPTQSFLTKPSYSHTPPSPAHKSPTHSLIPPSPYHHSPSSHEYPQLFSKPTFFLHSFCSSYWKQPTGCQITIRSHQSTLVVGVCLMLVEGYNWLMGLTLRRVLMEVFCCWWWVFVVVLEIMIMIAFLMKMSGVKIFVGMNFPLTEKMRLLMSPQSPNPILPLLNTKFFACFDFY